MGELKEEQLPAKKDPWEIVYKSASGIEVKLNPSIVRKYLVHGKAELATDQEIVFFMNICRARGLNPLIKDAYLVKYNEDPAAIITSIDFFRKRAKAQKDCKGWDSGIIVMGIDKKPRDTKGLVLDGETVIGGWFEAQPEGWTNKFRLEVNLRAYIKKTKEGKTTRFWSEENWPTMIRKVAESQGLRELWPDEFAKIYSAEELGVKEEDLGKDAIDIEVSSDQTGSAIDPKVIEKFNEMALAKKPDVAALEQFLERTAKAQQPVLTVEELKFKLGSKPQDFDKFWIHFEKNTKLHKRSETIIDVAEEKEKFVDCPNAPGEQRTEKFCNEYCKKREGCPVY